MNRHCEAAAEGGEPKQSQKLLQIFLNRSIMEDIQNETR